MTDSRHSGLNFNGTTIHGVIMDLDGVLWRGSVPLPGAAAWLKYLRDHGIPFALATNNSSKAPADYAAKFIELGLGEIAPAQVITSGIAAAAHLQAAYPAGSHIHVLGGDGLRALVSGAGMVVDEEPTTPPVAVVVGIDLALTYAKLKRAALLIRAGADFIGTNADATFPLPDGLAPGAGSLLAALHTATGSTPLIMGKPNPPMFMAALKHLATDAAHTLMIGDRLDTDIMGAARIGLRTALVLTGVTTAADAAVASTRPEAAFADLPGLHAAFLRDNRQS